MLVAIVPASPKTAAVAIRYLLRDPSVKLRAVYRDPTKAPEEFVRQPNFEAVRGDVSDGSSLDLTGCDAVINVTPPGITARDIVQFARTATENVRTAIEKAGSVKKLVLLSSVGAQHSKGVGEIKTNNAAEVALRDTKVPEVTYVRCSYFMENWTVAMDTLLAPEPFFFSTITPADSCLPMIAVEDIGRTLAEEVLKQNPSSSPEPYIYELHGPSACSPLDVQKAFTKALGKHVELKLIQPSELHGFYSQILSPETVPNWVEMAESLLPGGILDWRNGDTDGKPVVKGKVELDDAILAAVKAR